MEENDANVPKKGMNILSLRTVALAVMAVLNFAWSGIIANEWLQLLLGFIGCGSLTLFLFLLDEGYRNTSNLTKYMIRLLALSVVSAVPYYLVYGNDSIPLYSPQNFFSSPLTLFLCLGGIALYDKLKNKQLGIVCVIFLCIVSYIFSFEWCPYAVIIAFIIHIYHDKPRYRDFYITMFFITFAVVNAVMYLMGFFKGADVSEILRNISLAGCIWPVFIIRKYSGERGKRVRFAAYSAYPLMLLALYLIKVLISK